jgi:4'-phosphopantetheinyl transferase
MRITAVSVTRFLPRHDLAGCLGWTADDKVRRLERFHRDEDYLRGLLGDVLARHVIARDTGLAPGAIVFDLGPFDKPCVAGRPDLQFNISHSGAWVACVLDGTPVGVDVEQIRPIDAEIPDRYFSAIEQAQIREADEARRRERFFTLWTLKESYVKMMGQGLAIPLPGFSVVARASGGFGIVTSEGPVESAVLAATNRLPGYSLAVCAHTLPAIETLEIVPMDELLALTASGRTRETDDPCRH